VKLITTQSLRFFKQSTRPQAIGCTELLDSVLDLYHSRILNANITVDRRDRSTTTIVCMESEIRQVLNNLVSNAIDAMSTFVPGVPTRLGGRLTIRTREATEPRSGSTGILLTIADTGIGISPETVREIYKAFYTTKGLRGTGLGLWISSEIVERHQGRLLVRSSTRSAGHGTVFRLYLPYQGLTPS
jgi:signal transduction histidine kinase